MAKQTAELKVKTPYGEEITVTYELITPEIATELLAHNGGNRNARPTRIRQYKHDMAAGLWHDTGDPIRISNDGHLLDGQHRLWAIIESDSPQWMLVIRGMDPSCQMTMNSGASRKLSDYLKFRGESNVTNLAAMANADAKWNLVSHSAPFGSGFGTGLSFSSTMRWFDDHADDIREAVRRGDAISSATGNLLPRTMTGVLWLNFSRINSDDADEFWSKYVNNVGLEETMPVLTLKNTLAQLKSQSNNAISTTTRYKAAVTIKAWNEYRAHRGIRVLTWHPAGPDKESFPDPR